MLHQIPTLISQGLQRKYTDKEELKDTQVFRRSVMTSYDFLFPYCMQNKTLEPSTNQSGRIVSTATFQTSIESLPTTQLLTTTPH